MAWRRPWIKLWVEMLDDPKMLSLSESQRWVWCALLLATTRSPDPGRMLLPNGRPMSARQLWQAARTDMSMEAFEETLKLMEELEMAAWQGDTLEILHWHKRQDPQDVTAAERMRRYRQRQSDGQAAVTDVTPSVTPPVTSPVTRGVTPGDRPSDASPKGVSDPNKPDAAMNDRNNRNADRNAERNDSRNAVTLLRPQEEQRGRGEGGSAPLQKNRNEEENPSGAIAPSGPAPSAFSNSPGTVPQGSGSLDRGKETVPPAPAAAGPDVQDSSPPEAGGGDAAPRPETNGQVSSPDTHRDGGETAAPRAMTSRKKTGGNPAVDRALAAIQELWGQPIVHWAKEAREVKAALGKGYQPEQIVACWKAAQECTRWKGRWMPLAYLVEDLGEFVNNGERPLRKWGYQPGKEEGRAENRSTLPTAKEWRSRRGRW